ncbi:hypothetical protein NIES4074_17160 [Cylindrospermum sp. NIES-4074]|nr:hypothetical protein NIES4074_17160 [Cylindrospermum sp. NIES-4074]
MVRITISDLYPSRDEQFIDELSAGEMLAVAGGSRRRRRRRQRGSSTGDTAEVTNIMDQIDNRIDQIGSDLNQTNEDLQKQFGY